MFRQCRDRAATFTKRRLKHKLERKVLLGTGMATLICALAT